MDAYYWILTLALFLVVTLIIGGTTLGAMRFMYEQEIQSESYLKILDKKRLDKPLTPDESFYERFIQDKYQMIITLEDYTDLLLIILVGLAVILAIIRVTL